MEITYVGHSCFKIKGKDVNLLIDPYEDGIGYKVTNQKADILLISHEHTDHNNRASVSVSKMTIDNPGEYEVSDVVIYGYPTFHDDSNGSERGKNTIYTIDIDGFRILHLGDLGHQLQKKTLEKLAEIDVLMVPVGGTYTINAEVAANVVAAIEPAYVIPMHYQTEKLKLPQEIDGVKKFLDELGGNGVTPADKLRLSNRSDIPEETTVVVLEHTA